MRRTTLGSILAVCFALIVGIGAAFGYWLSTDHSSPAQAAAATLTAPTTPTATATSPTAITVGWSLPSSQLAGAQYQVTRTSPGTPTTLCTVSSTTTSCPDTNLIPGTTYHYSTVAIYPSSLWQSSAILASTTTPQETPSISTQTSTTLLAVGGSLTDQATVTGGYTPTGTITWTAYATSDATCATPLFSYSSTKPISGDSTYASDSLSPTAPGTYNWGISYSGDTSNAAVSHCGGPNESFIVGQASPQIATTASTSVAVGASVTDTATLSNGYHETGTITYTLYGPSASASCVPGDMVGSVTNTAVSGNGSYLSPSISPPSAGTYWWIASYGGDANNAAVADTCGASNETVAITKVTPTITTTTGSSSFTVGGTVSDTAHFSGGYNATGTITWQVYAQGDSLCGTPLFGYSSTATVSGGGPTDYSTASPAMPTSVGNYMWGLVYGPDVNNNQVTLCGGSGEDFTVTKASPTLSASAPSSSPAGTAITPSANLAGGVSPTGSISFRVFGPQSTAPTTCTSGGTAVGTTVPVSGNNTYNANASYSPSVVGTYWWYASFSDTDGNNNPATSTCNSGTMTKTVVGVASPTLSVAAPSTGTAGTAISASSITATLSGSSGTNDVNAITIKVFNQTSAPSICTSGGTTVGTATPAGNGTYVSSAGFTPGTAGNYWWYVSSGADTNNNAAASTCNSASMTKTVVAAGAASASASTVSANPTSVAADGSTTSTITVTLLDASNNPVSGKTVTLGQGSGSSSISASSGPSNSSGVVTFTVKDATAQTVTYTATDTTDSNLVITQTASVIFNSVTGIEWASVTKPKGSISCTGAGTSNYTCTITGAGNNAAVTAQIMFVNSSGVATVDSTTQSETVGVSYDSNWKTGTGPTSLTVAQNTTTSTGTPASGTISGSNTGTMTATFGSFTATLIVES